jgi:hypothetical protein
MLCYLINKDCSQIDKVFWAEIDAWMGSQEVLTE